MVDAHCTNKYLSSICSKSEYLWCLNLKKKHLSNTITELLAVTVLYHFENDTVVLPCEQLSNEQIVWQGPEKYSTYGYGDIINPKFSKSNRLTIIHVNGSNQYNLQIRRFSSEDEGNYKCVRGSGGEEYFTLTVGSKSLQQVYTYFKTFHY